MFQLRKYRDNKIKGMQTDILLTNCLKLCLGYFNYIEKVYEFCDFDYNI